MAYSFMPVEHPVLVSNYDEGFSRVLNLTFSKPGFQRVYSTHTAERILNIVEAECPKLIIRDDHYPGI